MVAYPQLREELLFCVHAFSSPEHQRQIWVNRIFPDGKKEYPLFWDGVNFLFDWLGLPDTPEHLIGSVLKSEEEVAALLKLTKQIDDVLDEVGYDATDAEYISSSNWQNVIDAASITLELLQANQ
jgi:hypothetical protein